MQLAALLLERASERFSDEQLEELVGPERRAGP